MGCATTHCMISSTQSSRRRKTHVFIQRLVGMLQRQRQKIVALLYSRWFLLSRSSRLPRPLHFFGWEIILENLNLPKAYPTDTFATIYNHLKRPTAQNYSLRSRPHKTQLPDRISRITGCNFPVRMLYRNMYWLLYILPLRFVVFLCTSAVRQFVINEYVMLCYVS